MHKTSVFIRAVAAIVIVGVAIMLWQGHTTAPSPTSQPSTTATSTPSAKAPAHIFVILEENKTYSDVINSADAPYINSLAKHYALAANYNGVAHPSLPNYLALTSGSTDGVTTDCSPPAAGCIVNVKNIADEIEASKRTWKAYAESMPAPCYILNHGDYATKHNPFIYYKNIVKDTARCQAHDVPLTQLTTDLSSVATTPDFAFVTPNLCNDMHNCSVATGDVWLKRYAEDILQSKAFTSSPSLLVITWDEAEDGGNHIPTIFAGSAAKMHFISNARYDHYSLLRTVEEVWGLTPLTSHDAQAVNMDSLLK